MLHKTKGIVFKTTDYTESSIIVKVFTEKFGLQSYLINGAKKPKARVKFNTFQPLHLLEMVVYHKPAANLQRLSEVRQLPVLQSIPYDITKSSIAFFMNEVLYKSVKQQSEDLHLFDFLYHSIQLLDRMEAGKTLFHHLFLLKLSRYLGFSPRLSDRDKKYFDLREGVFTDILPVHAEILHPPFTAIWKMLMLTSFENLHQIKLSNEEKRHLLERMLNYYRLHVEGFGEIKSHQILEEVLE